jgi:HD-GYP domain-containing protein (c-di-GMP phosphodiesterase class II)
MGYQSVMVTDEYTEDIEPADIISPVLRMQANIKAYEFYNRQDNLNDSKRIYELRDMAREIVDEVILMEGKVLVEFPELKTFDDYLYLHSVNVAVLGVLLGRKLELNDKMLEDYVMGALLHDIGKVDIPQEILRKNGPLDQTEFEVMKKHPRTGYNILQRSLFLKPRSFVISLQHHEAFDGSGYPNGKQKEEIHVFSRIAAVVDIFDALTSDRPYKKRWSFKRTREHFNSIKKKLDPSALGAFLKIVPLYLVGSTVKLSTGEVAVVISNRTFDFNKPVVRVINDQNGRVIPKNEVYQIELTQHPEIKILASYDE